MPSAGALIEATTIRVRVGPGRVLSFRRDYVRINETGDFGWFGKIEGPDDSQAGILSLTVRGREVAGSATVNGEVFQIQALDGALHALSPLDLRRVPRPSDDTPRGTTSEGPRLNRMEGAESSSTCTYCKVRVLVLYTPAAAASVPNIQSVISEAFNETNYAYENSAIGGIELVEAGRLQVSYTEGGPEGDAGQRINADLAEIKTLFAGLRDQYKADLFVLLTSSVYSDSWGTIYGSVQELRLGADNAHAIVVAPVAVSSQGSGYTFAHEVGHLFGAQHNPENLSPPTPVNYPFEFGHRFSYKPFFGERRRHRTVMAYPDYEYDYRPVPYFSNPNVTYDHTATGTSSRDNAQVHRLTKAGLAAYRPEPLTASISGPTSGSTGQRLDFAAVVNYPPTGLTYTWQESPDGVTYQSVATGSTYGRVIKSYDTSFWLRLIVSSGTETAFAFSYVSVNGGGCGGCSRSAEGEEVLADVPEAFEVHAPTPNPARSGTTVRVGLPEPARVSVAVYDVLGRAVRRLPELDLAPGTHEVAVSTEGLPAGTYVFRVEAGAAVGTRTLVVAR